MCKRTCICPVILARRKARWHEVSVLETMPSFAFDDWAHALTPQSRDACFRGAGLPKLRASAGHATVLGDEQFMPSPMS